MGLKRDEHAEAMARLEYGGDAHESADRSDEQSDVTDGIPVNGPEIETIEMWRQPGR